MERGRSSVTADARTPSAASPRLMSATSASSPAPSIRASGLTSAISPRLSDPSGANRGKAAQQPGRSEVQPAVPQEAEVARAEKCTSCHTRPVLVSRRSLARRLGRLDWAGGGLCMLGGLIRRPERLAKRACAQIVQLPVAKGDRAPCETHLAHPSVRHQLSRVRVGDADGLPRLPWGMHVDARALQPVLGLPAGLSGCGLDRHGGVAGAQPVAGDEQRHHQFRLAAGVQARLGQAVEAGPGGRVEATRAESGREVAQRRRPNGLGAVHGKHPVTERQLGQRSRGHATEGEGVAEVGRDGNGRMRRAEPRDGLQPGGRLGQEGVRRHQVRPPPGHGGGEAATDEPHIMVLRQPRDHADLLARHGGDGAVTGLLHRVDVAQQIPRAHHHALGLPSRARRILQEADLTIVRGRAPPRQPCS
eukprot:scaffold32007_cov101-Isochrysis_galbana.AAC.5